MMWKDGLLTNPCFYLSEFFDRCNSEYQDRLLAVSSEGDWTGWCQFFLRAVRDQAVENNKRVHGMYALNEDLKRRLAEKSGSAHASIVIDKLFEKAIFSRSEFVKIDGMVPGTKERIGQLKEQQARARRDLESLDACKLDAVVFADFLQSGTLLDDRSLLDAFVYQALVSEECVLVTLNYDDKKLEPARVSLSRVLTDCVWLPGQDSNLRHAD